MANLTDAQFNKFKKEVCEDFDEFQVRANMHSYAEAYMMFTSILTTKMSYKKDRAFSGWQIEKLMELINDYTSNYVSSYI